MDSRRTPAPICSRVGTVIYQMATGTLPFPGDTSAVVFDAILNREPTPIGRARLAACPAISARVVDKALEKDRNFRYQTATELKTDLVRLKRDLDSGRRKATPASGPHQAAETASVAVLYFENLSGVKEDEVLPRRHHRGHHHGALEDPGSEDLSSARRCWPIATSR